LGSPLALSDMLDDIDDYIDIPEPMLTADQVAAIYSVSKRTVYRWALAGAPHYKLGPKLVRFRISELVEYLEQEEEP